MSQTEIEKLAQIIAERLYIRYGYHSVPIMKREIIEVLSKHWKV